MSPGRNFVIFFVIGFLRAILEVTPGTAQVQEAGAPSSAPPRVPSVGPLRAGPDPSSESQSFLEKAVIRMESCDSISAKTRQSVELFGKRLVGSGSYLEWRSTQRLMFRLELKFQ